jgi:hypothetical protein
VHRCPPVRLVGTIVARLNRRRKVVVEVVPEPRRLPYRVGDERLPAAVIVLAHRHPPFPIRQLHRITHAVGRAQGGHALWRVRHPQQAAAVVGVGRDMPARVLAGFHLPRGRVGQRFQIDAGLAGGTSPQ